MTQSTHSSTPQGWDKISGEMDTLNDIPDGYEDTEPLLSTIRQVERLRFDLDRLRNHVPQLSTCFESRLATVIEGVQFELQTATNQLSDRIEQLEPLEQPRIEIPLPLRAKIKSWLCAVAGLSTIAALLLALGAGVSGSTQQKDDFGFAAVLLGFVAIGSVGVAIGMDD